MLLVNWSASAFHLNCQYCACCVIAGRRRFVALPTARLTYGQVRLTVLSFGFVFNFLRFKGRNGDWIESDAAYLN